MIAAVILAGGRATRLGGADKAGVDVDGRRLIDASYAAVAGAAPVIAVGPPSIARDGVTVIQEDPPFGGPVAGLAAALDALAAALPTTAETPTETWLLACDLPRAELIVGQLRDVPIPEGADGLLLTDSSGREQWLAGRYRISSLRRALDTLPEVDGVSMRRLLAVMSIHSVDDRVHATLDLDTWADVERYRRQEALE